MSLAANLLNMCAIAAQLKLASNFCHFQRFFSNYVKYSLPENLTSLCCQQVFPLVCLSKSHASFSREGVLSEVGRGLLITLSIKMPKNNKKCLFSAYLYYKITLCIPRGVEYNFK